jgi:DNA-binding response OmpR family regulator
MSLASEILLVDDSEETGVVVRLALGNLFRVTQVSKEAEVYSQIAQRRFDLILLDVNLPDLDGFEFFKKLRNNDRTREIPVIFVTGKNTTADEAMGLSLGAEDYVTKPFEPLKLRARVQARLNQKAKRHEQGDWIRRGDFRLSVSSQRVIMRYGQQDVELRLTRHEFQILSHLLRHEEQVVTQEQLLFVVGEAWEDKSAEVMDRVVDQHVSSLCKKLGKRADCIESVSGGGYCFRSSVTQRNAS